LVFVQTTNCFNKDDRNDEVYQWLQAAYTTVLPSIVKKYSDFWKSEKNRSEIVDKAKIVSDFCIFSGTD
jgi:hypothetical protein